MAWLLDCAKIEKLARKHPQGLMGICRMVGMGRAHLSLIVNQRRADVRISTLSKLATALMIHPGDLLTVEGPERTTLQAANVVDHHELAALLMKHCQELREELATTHQRLAEAEQKRNVQGQQIAELKAKLHRK